MPGVYGTTDTSGLQQGGSGRGIVQPGISSNGARGNMVNYSLDGAYHNDGYTNVSLPIPDPDALQEFSVQTNGFSAEYGRNAGGIVNAVTRSGTNTLHGTLFEFHRNAAVNAYSFFSTASDGLKRNQFGGTLGGPVYIPHVYNGRDRTFFFFSIQDQTQVQTPTDSSTTVLTPAQRIGDFSARAAPIVDPTTGTPFPGNQIPLSRMDVVTRNLLNSVIPQPTVAATGLLRYSVPNTNNFRQYAIKVDHNFGSKDMLSARYFDTYYHVPSYNAGLIFSLASEVQAPSHDFAATYTHIFSPTTLDQVQFTLIRRTSSNLPTWTKNFKQFGVQNIGTDTSVAAQELILSVSGAFSFDVGETDVTSPNAVAITDTLRHTSGRHETVLGFEFRRETLNKFYHFLMDPQFVFNGNATGYGVADFFLGDVDSLVQSAFGERANLSHPSYAAFAQDNIQLTPHFKLNLGLRFEPFIPWRDSDGRGVAFACGSTEHGVPERAARAAGGRRQWRALRFDQLLHLEFCASLWFRLVAVRRQNRRSRRLWNFPRFFDDERHRQPLRELSPARHARYSHSAPRTVRRSIFGCKSVPAAVPPAAQCGIPIESGSHLIPAKLEGCVHPELESHCRARVA